MKHLKAGQQAEAASSNRHLEHEFLGDAPVTVDGPELVGTCKQEAEEGGEDEVAAEEEPGDSEVGEVGPRVTLDYLCIVQSGSPHNRF